MTQIALAVALPVVAAVLIVAGGRTLVRGTRWLAVAGPLGALYVGTTALASSEQTAGSADAGPVAWLGTEAGGLAVGTSVDALAAVMLIVVGVVASMVVVFSIGYMAEDRSQVRYFALLSAFSAAMSALVMSSTLLGLFVAWELVGACSYLLIGFWFTRPAAAAAAMKAFIVTRIGDVGLLLGIALLWRETGTLSFSGIEAALPDLAAPVVTAVALLVLMGAAGKSAQFPLHIWLPDAMEGPTPVSALIHAATMVAAGVFLVARMWSVFEAAEAARTVTLIIGTLTALGAATVAVTQTDIKKVLAYSTISQLGFMFAALGVGAWPAAMFHLATHAAFKSLLFLASGSVIHGSGTQDLHEMGGLGRAMPLTAATWTVGVAALAGLPPLSGFFSKDGVLEAVWEHAPIAGGVLLLASALTAFYAARATRLAFTGEFRGSGHPHESPLVMTVPLVILALAAVGLGFAYEGFAELFDAEAGLSVPIAVTTTVIALLMGAIGWRVYAPGRPGDAGVRARLGVAWRWSAAAYGVDSLSMRAARGVRAGCAGLAERFDGGVIDRAVNGVASLTRWIGAQANAFQTGEGSAYAAFVGVGAILLVSLALWLGR